MVSSAFPCLINRLTDLSCPIPNRSAIHQLLTLVWLSRKLPQKKHSTVYQWFFSPVSPVNSLFEATPRPKISLLF
jgi:hypothetical protein